MDGSLRPQLYLSFWEIGYITVTVNQTDGTRSRCRVPERRKLDKELKEAGCQEKAERKKRYEDYISDRSNRSAAAAVISRRPPYYLTYIRQAKAGCLPWQKDTVNKDSGKERQNRLKRIREGNHE